MNKIGKFQPYAAAIALVSYLIFALAAYRSFPTAYSPARNWLSDLGSADLNPGGAAFYNLGIILTALLVLLFFLGTSRWQMAGRKIQQIMVGLTQVFGILGSLAMLLSAIFPINHPEQHQVFSIALYFLLGTAFAFSVAALRYLPQVPRWLLALGVITAAVDMLSGVFNQVTALEWVTVGMFLVYMVAASQVADN